jgi:hypothetical protein
MLFYELHVVYHYRGYSFEQVLAIVDTRLLIYTKNITMDAECYFTGCMQRNDEQLKRDNKFQ